MSIVVIISFFTPFRRPSWKNARGASTHHFNLAGSLDMHSSIPPLPEKHQQHSLGHGGTYTYF